MKRLSSIILIWLAIFCVSSLAENLYSFNNGQQLALFQSMTQTVRCLVCQNQNVADSSSPFAASMRNRIADMVLLGKTERQIEKSLVSHYGEKVLFKPSNDVRMWLLWYGPLGILVLLFAVLARRKES
mgnify:CR=1 FL=1